MHGNATRPQWRAWPAPATSTSEGGWPRALAVGVGVTALLEVLLAVVLAVAAGFTWDVALEAFLATNATDGRRPSRSAAVLIAWYRPRHPLGWLLVAGGFCLRDQRPDGAGVRAACSTPAPRNRCCGSRSTVFMFAWPWSITLFLPLVLLLFPDGHLPSPRWRWVAWAVVLTAPLFVLEMVSGPEPVSAGMPDGYLVVAAHDDLSAGCGRLSEIRVMLALVLRAGRPSSSATAAPTRRSVAQLLWLLLAVLVVVAAVTAVVVRGRHADRRALRHPADPAGDRGRRRPSSAARHPARRLPGGRVAAACRWPPSRRTSRLVALLDTLVSDGARASPPSRRSLVAVALAPLLPRLQREVDRWMYGDRRDPGARGRSPRRAPRGR